MPNKLTAELLAHARELKMSAEQREQQKTSLASIYSCEDIAAILRIEQDFDTTMKYWIDGENKLWHGPSSPEENLHYSKFEGFMRVAPFGEIWVLQRSSPPDTNHPVDGINEISLEEAKDYLRKAWMAQQTSSLLD